MVQHGTDYKLSVLNPHPFCASDLASEEAYMEAVLESPQDGKHETKSEFLKTVKRFCRDTEGTFQSRRGYPWNI